MVLHGSFIQIKAFSKKLYMNMRDFFPFRFECTNFFDAKIQFLNFIPLKFKGTSLIKINIFRWLKILPHTTSWMLIFLILECWNAKIFNGNWWANMQVIQIVAFELNAKYT